MRKALLSLAFAAACAGAPVDTGNFTESTFVTVPDNATGMAWAPDGSGRLFVTIESGAVRVVQNGSLLSTAFATISPVTTAGEGGVLGIAFDPDYVNNHYVYFFVTVDTGEQQIIRYTDTASVGGSKTTILSSLPTTGNNHNAGGIAFGPDGKLYFAIGDNGTPAGVNDDLLSLASKVGRVNKDGSTPNDNPFYDAGGSNNDLIWARGFRNPFSMTFNPFTGRHYVNVVGNQWEQVFVIAKGDHAGWNTYELNQPTSGYVRSRILWRTTTSPDYSITAISRSSNVVTVTEGAGAIHCFRVGSTFTVAGVTDSSFNGTFTVTASLSDSQWQYAQTGSNASSSGGTATLADYGGAITGGIHYDSTAFPSGYWGNYFVGDYNTGTIIRAQMDGSDTPTQIDPFITGHTNQIDISVGPDGALYYLSYEGSTIRRLEYTGDATQQLVVQSTRPYILEGGDAVLTVSLKEAPGVDVTVATARTAGDTSITVDSGSSLTFTPSNWYIPQVVSLGAAEDADFTASTATIEVSAAGLTTRTVTATEIENDETIFVLNKDALTVTEGSSGTFTVALNTSANLSVTVARTAGDSDITVSGGSSLTFTTGDFATPQTVTIAAASDGDTTDDTATISISATGQSTRTITVTVTDDDANAPAITSTAITTAVDDAPYTYTVTATGTPAPTFALTTFPTGMTIDDETGVITYTPSAPASHSVVIEASNGVGSPATQSFTLVVAADQAPTAHITLPVDGSTISGTNSEFFGGADDDVGTTHADFYVDGVLQDTDTNDENHYHIHGNHRLFNTRLFANGSHTLRMTVTDTKGQTGFQEITVTIANFVNRANAVTLRAANQ